MKKLLSITAFCCIAFISGCQSFAPTVPPSVTFNNPQPRWSWTGTWRGNSGATMNITQTGNQWVATGEVSGIATISGNRAIGRATDGIPRTFEFVLSDDGMYANGTVTAMGITSNALLSRIGKPEALHATESPNGSGIIPIPRYTSANQVNQSDSIVTIEQLQAWSQDNALMAEQTLQGKGAINIQGRVERVTEKEVILAGDSYPKIVCQFPLLPRAYGQPFSYATPAAARSLNTGDTAIVNARFKKYLFPSRSTAQFVDCNIIQAMPSVEVPSMRSQSQPAVAIVEQRIPAGYYQCYRFTVAISANSCPVGDLELDGRGNYSSTRGAGGSYVFDSTANIVTFSGGVLNGRQALTKISSKGTFMLRMRVDGMGLPSPKQTHGTYSFEHKSSGRRDRW